MPPAIRRAVEADAADIARILSAAFASYQPLYTPEAYNATVPRVGEISRRFPEGPVWIATDPSAVGTVSALLKPQGLYIRSMAVVSEARGRRIGLALMQVLETFAREQNCPRLFLYTTPFLDGAIRLYQRCGFATTGPDPEFFGTPLIEMEKAIEPRP